VVVNVGGPMGAFGAPVSGLGQVGAFSTSEVVPGTNNCTYGDIAIGPGGKVMKVCTLTESGQGGGKLFVNVDPTAGRIAVVWYDSRNDLGTGGTGDTDGLPNDDAQFWGAFSADGPSFGPNVLISAGTSNSHDAHNGIDYGDYSGLAYFGGVAHPAWADNSNSTGNNPDGALRLLDVYTAAVPAPWRLLSRRVHSLRLRRGGCSAATHSLRRVHHAPARREDRAVRQVLRRDRRPGGCADRAAPDDQRAARPCDRRAVACP
jgi:hypothetical protein